MRFAIGPITERDDMNFVCILLFFHDIQKKKEKI